MRFFRRLLNPLLKLFFNPNPLIRGAAPPGEAECRSGRTRGGTRSPPDGVECSALRDPAASRDRGLARQPRDCKRCRCGSRRLGARSTSTSGASRHRRARPHRARPQRRSLNRPSPAQLSRQHVRAIRADRRLRRRPDVRGRAPPTPPPPGPAQRIGARRRTPSAGAAMRTRLRPTSGVRSDGAHRGPLTGDESGEESDETTDAPGNAPAVQPEHREAAPAPPPPSMPDTRGSEVPLSLSDAERGED